MFTLKDKLSEKLENAAEEKIRKEVDKAAGYSDEDLFSFAEYDEEEAEKALRECSRSAKEAIVMIKLGCDAESAKLALKKAGGFVRKAIKE